MFPLDLEARRLERVAHLVLRMEVRARRLGRAGEQSSDLLEQRERWRLRRERDEQAALTGRYGASFGKLLKIDSSSTISGSCCGYFVRKLTVGMVGFLLGDSGEMSFSLSGLVALSIVLSNRAIAVSD